MSSQFFYHFFALVLLHLVLLGMFVAQSSTHVLALSQFLLCIFLLSPAELAWYQVIK
jgi:hypothetical protein